MQMAVDKSFHSVIMTKFMYALPVYRANQSYLLSNSTLILTRIAMKDDI